MDGFPRKLRYHFLARARRERLAGPIYAAMVDNLFGTLVGFAALGFTSILLAIVTFLERPNIGTGVGLAVMLTIATLRAVLMIGYRRWKSAASSSISGLAQWEIGYAALGIAMMLGIGSLCCYNVLQERSNIALLISIIVTMGIAGCIAGRNGSRPTIVLLQLISVFSPLLGALAYENTREGWIVFALIILFIYAAMSSTKSVYMTLRSTLLAQQRNKQLSLNIKRSAALFDTALNNMTSGLLLFDRERRLVVANEKVKVLLGRNLIERMMGRPTRESCYDLYQAFEISQREGERFTYDFRRIMEEGKEDVLTIMDHRRQRTFELRLRVMPSRGVVLNVDDVTEQRAKDAEIYRLAHRDPLTDLPNRASLMACLEHKLSASSMSEVVTVMYLDLDRFKEVNDELGHAAGDKVLIEVARRLQGLIREDDFVARIGGDEFVFILSTKQDTARIEEIAARLIAAVSQPCRIGARQVLVGASVGLTIADHGDGAAEEALRTADVALYEAKLHGKGRATWFETAMDDRLRTRREMVIELSDALTTGKGLDLYYQPIFDAKTGRVVACEALMRWHHDVLGSIAPSIFIPLAEENGLICALGLWALEKSCRDASVWPDNSIKVAVNVSGLQFVEGEFSNIISEILAKTNLPSTRLEVEITESVLARDLASMSSELQALAKQGISVALDDFGTGFSSLSLLHKLPLDKIKLDRSFVSRLDEDPTAIALIASIVQMAQILRKQVVIEGVETASQLALVSSAQARLIQGYYFSRPMPQRSLLLLLQENKVNASELAQSSIPHHRLGSL